MNADAAKGYQLAIAADVDADMVGSFAVLLVV